MIWAWEVWCAAAGVSGIDAMARFMRGMLGGMVILVLPAFAVCTGITIMAYRRRNQWAANQS
jgi:hypothetical protein